MSTINNIQNDESRWVSIDCIFIFVIHELKKTLRVLIKLISWLAVRKKKKKIKQKTKYKNKAKNKKKKQNKTYS